MDQLRRPSRVLIENDLELVQRCRNGDSDAFADLVIRYQRPVYNAALWILRKPEDASDVAQTVFLKVVENLDEYDSRFRLFSWIYRIAVNESLNLLRRNGREEALDEEADFADDDRAGPESRFDAAQRAERLRRTIHRMSTQDRTVLVLRHFGELSYDAIGETLGIDQKTVKSRLFDARHRLRDLLKDLRTT
ncbi:MAG TPA: sigma-70 family RNA polymerase sigma factor [Casimicrobiaceae bacterium]|nr:sigma-70 family RNA polymerase sigma factor [Casimicrobiaceae bacterium]